MDQFSSPQVAKALGLHKGRLREWVDEGFVNPSVRAEGQGTQAVFSRKDVYQTALFSHLLDLGFTRAKAGSFIKHFYNPDPLASLLNPHDPGQIDYIVFTYRKSVEGFNLHAIFFAKKEITSLDLKTANVKLGQVGVSAAGHLKEGEAPGDYDTLIVINYAKLRKEIDTALKGI